MRVAANVRAESGRADGLLDGATREAVEAIVPGARFGEPMSRHTTWGVGGPADAFVEPDTADQVGRLLRLAAERGLPVYYLGNGSNLLVGDRGMRGLVIRLGRAFRQARVEGTDIEAGAALSLSRLVKIATNHGLASLEFCLDIPGTVGGALVMNAGTPEGEFGDRMLWVRVMHPDGREEVIPKERVEFRYRRSSLHGSGLLVLGCRLGLRAGDPAAIQAEVNRLHARRMARQPIHCRSAGSVFKNPPGDYAGRLIEAAGGKGARVGGAVVSEKHANFIINTGGASASDVLALMRQMQERVRERFGVGLEPEVQIVGEW